MVIRIWHPCIVLSCLVIPCLFAKTFSLNEAIAAEERQKDLQTTSRPRFEPETSEGFSRSKVLRIKSITPKNHKAAEKSETFSLTKALKTKLRSNPLKKATENIFPGGKKISSLQYRKIFQIKSPLKPKKLKSFKKVRQRRRNQSLKRKISEDDKISKKYIPLLRSLSLLFDNIFAETDDSVENRRPRVRKYRHSKQTQCTCTDKPNRNKDSDSTKETVISTTPLNEVSTIEPAQRTTTEVATTTTDCATNSDVSDLGPNTDIPAILPRDPHSTRGDHNGDSKGSNPTFHTSIEGNISRDYGNSERNTGSGEYKPHTKIHEEDTNSSTREHASSTEFGRRLRGDIPDTQRPVYRRGSDETFVNTERKDDNPRQDRRHVYEFEGQNHSERKDGFRYVRGDFNDSAGETKHEIGGDEAEGPRSIHQFVRGDRRFEQESSVDDHAQLVQSQKDHKEGIVDIPHYITSDQRLTNRNGASTSEDQKIGPANAALISIKDFSNPIIMLQNSPKYKAPFVTITDGYSVVKDKNGANKLTEQSIRFHS